MARPKTMAKKKIINLPDDLLALIDDYRYANRIPTESDAIRRLIVRGLATDELEHLVGEQVRLVRMLHDRFQKGTVSHRDLMAQFEVVGERMHVAKKLMSIELPDLPAEPTIAPDTFLLSARHAALPYFADEGSKAIHRAEAAIRGAYAHAVEMNHDDPEAYVMEQIQNGGITEYGSA